MHRRVALACGMVLGCGAASGEVDEPTIDRRCVNDAREHHNVPPEELGEMFPKNDAPDAPVVVAAKLVEGHRISGKTIIAPDFETMKRMHDYRVTGVTASFKLCIDKQGVPSSVERLSSSCFPRYDGDLRRAMLEWRYSPYLRDGQAVNVCTAINYVYRQN